MTADSNSLGNFRSELILSTYVCLCMITTPPLLSAREMMFGFLIRSDNACIYLLESDDSFG